MTLQPTHSASATIETAGSVYGRSLDFRATRPAIAIITPCCNEQDALPQLFERLNRVEARLAERAEVEWCFIDDGSTDETWPALSAHAARMPNCRAVRHEVNQGLTAAILTGIAHTNAPLICTIDADCTYDPAILPDMLARMTEGVDAVTASPYHPEGGVHGVASWRLWLSKLASACYRSLSRNKLHTYTSCFRVYRRAAIEGTAPRHGRFAGVAEMLWRIDRRGGTIVEHPAFLHGRKVGRSKLRVIPVMWEHARLLLRCAWERLASQREPMPTASADTHEI